MKVKDWLTSATKRLEKSGTGSARLDCLILLEDELKKDRSYVLAHLDDEITDATNLDNQLVRRAKHEPMAYIRGFTEFYGRKFLVNKNVLEPRPESETMIGLLVGLSLPSGAVIVDIGTGSGALAITAKLEFPKAKVVATDIDPKCLVVAKQNAKQLKAEIVFLTGDLFKPLSGKGYEPTALLANLPYVPDNYKINEAAAMEPRLAIFGGSDGLDLYRKLFSQIEAAKIKPKYVLTESIPPQHASLAKIAEQNGYSEQAELDFIQLFEINQ